MYIRNLSRQRYRVERWNGWSVVLSSAVIGGLIAGMWWLQSQARAALSQQQPFERRRLGQAPSRSHIQLRTHPARQEQPR